MLYKAYVLVVILYYRGSPYLFAGTQYRPTLRLNARILQ
jgi:hypothetical protein